MSGKVVYAVKQDVEEQHAEIRAQVDRVHTDLAGKIADLQQTLQVNTDDLSQKVEACSATAESASEKATAGQTKSETDISSLRAELSSLVAAVEERLQKAVAAAEENIQKAQASLQESLLGQVAALAQKLDQDVSAVRSEAEAASKSVQLSTTEAVGAHRTELDTIVAELRASSSENHRRLQEELERGLALAGDNQKQGEHRLEAAASAANERVEEHITKVENELEALHLASGSHHERHTDLISEIEDLTDFQKTTEARIKELLVDNENLRNAVSEVENITTRRVEWVIRDVSSKIRPSSPTNASLHRSWFSPRFNAGGLHGLQLELQYFRPTNKGFDLDDDGGDCAVFLWACKGTNLVYKLSVGSKVQQLEKVFNGRVPFGTRRFCWLKDQINREEDTLRVGVEILESVREVEHTITAPASVMDTEEDDTSLEGAVLFHRHVNNRTLALVQQQVDLMNARMIRRVEWRVEQASLLRRCFPPGSPLCSAQFAAGGLEGLQLIFYPSGYNGAQEGFCSVFLHGPAGAMLKGFLMVGAQRREISHFYETPGAFGRTNFCRFEGLVEESQDTLLLALDVEEAHQDSCASVSHPKVAPGDTRNQAQIEGVPQAAIESVVKVQRVPGRPGVGLETVKQLPSLWTAQPVAEKQAKRTGAGATGRLAALPPNYQSFSQIKVYEPPALKLPAPWKGAAAMANSHSASMPALTDKAAGRSGQQCEDSMEGAPGGNRRRKGRTEKAY